jgi:hypothetical protein
MKRGAGMAVIALLSFALSGCAVLPFFPGQNLFGSELIKLLPARAEVAKAFPSLDLVERPSSRELDSIDLGPEAIANAKGECKRAILELKSYKYVRGEVLYTDYEDQDENQFEWFLAQLEDSESVHGVYSAIAQVSDACPRKIASLFGRESRSNVPNAVSFENDYGFSESVGYGDLIVGVAAPTQEECDEMLKLQIEKLDREYE